MYILVVDDAQFENELVKFVLGKHGYEVQATDSPRGALQMMQKREPDLLILDVNMPYMNGFDFSKKLRAEGYETPIIFVTAQHTIEAKLQGFDIGADDYICKPYDPQELAARVQAVLRRLKTHDNSGNQSIRSGQIELLPAELKVVMPSGDTIALTPKEMQVLRMLMERPGQVVDRGHILSEVWNEDGSSSNNVDVYIRRLRIKLEADPYHPQLILSVRSLGYKFSGK